MPRLKIAAAFAALLALIIALPAIPTSGSAAHAAQAIPGQYIVVLKGGANADAEAVRAERDHGAQVDFIYRDALNGFAFRGSAQAAAALAKNANVQFVSEDRAVEAVGKPGDIGTAAAQTTPTGVRRVGAGSLVNKGVGVGVAVIDTGIDLSHPDLTNATSGKSCVIGKTANDDNGHGSHVAGTIGAQDNAFGVVGVAPGVTLYAVKVLNARGSGTWSQVICGIDWVASNAAAKNIKVASMSLGGGGSNDNNCGNTNNDAMHQAICNATAKGITFVVAAGNSATNLDTFVPAAYPEALTVTAMSDSDGAPGSLGGPPSCRTNEGDDVPATFSNFAVSATAIGHTIAGPGVCILSTWKSGGYNTISGTSMATPHVSGIAALCIAAGNCGATPSAIIQKIRTDAAAVDSSFQGDPNSSPIAGHYYGYLAWAGGY